MFAGELSQPLGTQAWFENFDRIRKFIIREDKLPLWIGDDLIKGKKMLDVGCGPGYWCRTVRNSQTEYHGIDISDVSVELARQSAELFGCNCKLQIGNAEDIDFPDEHFDHVISEGVIHHTPGTQKALHEIIRVLKINGTATISVYYKNIFFRSKLLFGLCVFLMKLLNLSMKGRGRDKMKSADSVQEFIRMYDGEDNPIGKGYTKEEFVKLLPPGVVIKNHYLYFSPLRAFVRTGWNRANRILDRFFGLMICFSLTKAY